MTHLQCSTIGLLVPGALLAALPSDLSPRAGVVL